METVTSVYEEIGVVPVINATEHRTVLGGSPPSPRVRAAMDAAERHYVDMARLSPAYFTRPIWKARPEP